MATVIVVALLYGLCIAASVSIAKGNAVTLPDGTVEEYSTGMAVFLALLFGFFGPLIMAMYVSQRMPDGTLKVVALGSNRSSARRR